MRQRAERYQKFTPVVLADRRWPDNVIAKAPRWLSTDLRDGNQSLVSPMTPERKLAMFELLVDIGYKEIEVGFPVASQDDHDFLRMLIEQDRIPDDVRITVMVQARDELIRRTVESLRGAPRAVVHLYNATSPLFRRVVFGMTREECKDLAVQGTRLVMKYGERLLGECDLGFQYSPELFGDTELDFALEVCEAVMDVYQPETGRDIILNFPTTVERTTPNVFADQIEWMHRNLSRREHVCLSIHPHNDRGTGVASTELAVMAGAERVEGCLFGNGERAGNVCLVTLGLNLFAQGVDPGVDFSDINRIRRVVEECNGLPVHPRHPYGGDLVYTSFSGSHQDAIKKGFDDLARRAAATGREAGGMPWDMPYLLIDPADVGRTYETLVRINSQSGKGGVAYVLSTWHGLNLPRALQADFAGVVQAHVDGTREEVTPQRVKELFDSEYMVGDDRPIPIPPQDVPVTVTLHIDGGGFAVDGSRTTDVHTVREQLAQWGFTVVAVHRTPAQENRENREDHESREGREGREDRVAVYVDCSFTAGAHWGVGLGRDLKEAAQAAVRSAVLRARRGGAETGSGPIPALATASGS
ncbi:2-isopropylmalate synthase [Planobispora rosea]|nr:2-isopropylmalate synthase [Planobispora rosea]